MKIAKPLGILFAIGLILSVLGYVWWSNQISAPSTQSEKVRLVIKRGSSAQEIGENLYEAGVIKNPLAFKIYVQVTDRSGKIQAGEYNLYKNSPLPELVLALLQGPDEIWVTIPEGLRREQIALRFVDALSQDETFYLDFLELTKTKEGYLFPDTYLFEKDATAQTIVNKLLATFDDKISPFTNEIQDSDLSLNQIVVLSSLIERETKSNQERPIVAGVLLKRLEADWPLQVDASLQYALASQKCSECSLATAREINWWPKATADNKQIDSPFNTYKKTGIPPSPISNPGLTSIEAAIKPIESEYWYYIHSDDGQIHFAKTLEEHNQNIQTYLR